MVAVLVVEQFDSMKFFVVDYFVGLKLLKIRKKEYESFTTRTIYINVEMHH
jgi:hypothetical protein